MLLILFASNRWLERGVVRIEGVAVGFAVSLGVGLLF